MRATFEQLKGMNHNQLKALWWYSKFPFDEASECGNCLVQHNLLYNSCKVIEHQKLIKLVRELDIMQTNLPASIEQFYALRLFFDDFYPKDSPEVEAQIQSPALLVEEIQAT